MDNIQDELVAYVGDLRRSRRRHRAQEITLVSLAILLSALVTLAGVFKWPPEAVGVLGVLLSTVLTIERAFAFGERAVYSRILQAEAENLSDNVSLPAAERLAKFSDLRLRRAQARLGEGMAAIDPK
jgi:hypothetical protein